MEIPVIKDKVTARAFALAMAIKFRSSVVMGSTKYSLTGTTIDQASDFEKYIIGDAELPEVVEDPNMKILDIWNKVKESSEKSQRDTTEPIKKFCSKPDNISYTK